MMQIILLGAMLWAGLEAPAAAPQTIAVQVERTRLAAELARYQALIADYRQGKDDAIEAILQWDKKRITAAIGQINSKFDLFRPWEDDRFKAAAMLHTAAALSVIDRKDNLEVSAETLHDQLDAASRLLQKAGPGLRLYASRWYFSVARALRDKNWLYAEEGFLDIARNRQPDDPVVLFESGTTAEILATDYALAGSRALRAPSGSTPWGFRSTIDRRVGRLNEAAAWLRRSLERDPANNTVRLHLGRVQALREYDTEALGLLQAVFESTRDEATAYLSALFIGGVHERRQRLDRAADAYRLAIGKFPVGHAARVGLSEVLQRSGQGDESREVLRGLLTGAPGPTREPWWWYNVDPPTIAAERIAALVREVRP